VGFFKVISETSLCVAGSERGRLSDRVDVALREVEVAPPAVAPKSFLLASRNKRETRNHMAKATEARIRIAHKANRLRPALSFLDGSTTAW